jgi:hypothetical protein
MTALVTGPGAATAVAAPEVGENTDSAMGVAYGTLIARHSNKCLDVFGRAT